MKRVSIALIFLALSSINALAGNANDLWLLISSYEDAKITTGGLALFLQAHGYDAVVDRNHSYVKVNLEDRTVFLTPNGGSSGLADMWKTPPAVSPKPSLVIPRDAIMKDVTYRRSDNYSFFNELRKAARFPVEPLGMCYEGSKKLGQLYADSGYQIRYLYNSQMADWQGHIWVVVKDNYTQDLWLAVDSYYGVMTDDEYYAADYSFSDIKYLDDVVPKWLIA